MNASGFYERYWQRLAGASPDVGLETEPRKALLKAALSNLSPRTPVLDAGCGTGIFTAFLNDLGFTATGVDISVTAVTQAKEKCASARFQVAALETGLPFEDETFAAVWCSEVLEHLFNVPAALAELNRVLQPEGSLLLTTPYHGLLKNLIVALTTFDRHYNPYLSHIRFFTRRSLGVCLQRAGFAIDQWRGIGRHWPVWKSHFVVARKVGPPGSAPEIAG